MWDISLPHEISYVFHSEYMNLFLYVIFQFWFIGLTQWHNGGSQNSSENIAMHYSREFCNLPNKQVIFLPLGLLFWIL